MTATAAQDGSRILVVTTTVGSVEAAQALARRIVEQRLAACVQLEKGLASLYRWRGRLHEDAEARLVIKTIPGAEAALQALFAEHHPYELPQFVATVAQASAAYAEWVRGEVALPAADAPGGTASG